MEIIQTILFLIFVISAITKALIHIRLINTRENVSILKKSILIGFLCQPFIPIITEKDEKRKDLINYLVLTVYISLALLIIVEFVK